MGLKFGILREEKSPPDKRVPLTPAQCRELLDKYPETDIVVQPSPLRAYTEKEYTDLGIKLQEDLSDRDIILGVKEVPPENLIPNKTYLFFSHTIKEQPYNKSLLQTVLKNNIRLIDYEVLTDKNNLRIIGFGHYAGLVGAYNGLRGYGLRTGTYEIKPAWMCHNREEMERELVKVTLPPVKIIITGSGRVAHGAMDLLNMTGIKKVNPEQFKKGIFNNPVYTQLNSHDYHESLEGKSWKIEDFYRHPDKYRSTFLPYTKEGDILIHCSYWDPRAPKLFSREDMKAKEFKIKVIADVTCDIDGSIPSTLRPSTIEDPFFGYNPETETLGEPFSDENITVMAVDNLPCELPRDASDDFGKELMDKVIPAFITGDQDGIIARATIAENGKLTENFSYLTDYVS